MGYIFTLCALLAGYGTVIYLMQYFKNTKLTNYIFCAVVTACYATLAVIVYKDVGWYDWNFQNVLPCANVSPFMFTLAPLTFLFRGKARECLWRLISLLSVGMLFSSVLGCINLTIIHYAFHFHFLLDYIAHITLSLFGVYLVKSGQIDLDFKKCLKSGAIIVGVATCMVVLNLIFDTSFFGLSLRGKHNIYNNVLVDSSYLSALLYYVGLTAVLAFGYAFGKCFERKKEQ